MSSTYLSLRDTADILALEDHRLLRLGRYLHIAPGDKCIPAEVVIRARSEADADVRYRIVLNWLLDRVRSAGRSDLRLVQLDGPSQNGHRRS